MRAVPKEVYLGLNIQEAPTLQIRDFQKLELPIHNRKVAENKCHHQRVSVGGKGENAGLDSKLRIVILAFGMQRISLGPDKACTPRNSYMHTTIVILGHSTSLQS